MPRKRIDRADLAAFVRKQNPMRAPPFHWWHAAMGVLLALLILLAVLAPGLVADISNIPVASSEWLTRMRYALIGLMVYNILFVRYGPAWRTWAYLLISVGLLSRAAQNEFEHIPLTLSFLAVNLGWLIEVLGVVFRPTLSEQLQQVKQDKLDLQEALNAVETANAKLADEVALLRARETPEWRRHLERQCREKETALDAVTATAQQYALINLALEEELRAWRVNGGRRSTDRPPEVG